MLSLDLSSTHAHPLTPVGAETAKHEERCWLVPIPNIGLGMPVPQQFFQSFQ